MTGVRCLRLPAAAWAPAAVLMSLIAQAARGAEPKFLVTADNPNPKSLPTLGVWVDDKLSATKKLTMVSAAFPNVPGFVCDSWCY